MTAYWLAPALATLRGEIDDIAPDRSTASDGWIGDPSHASRDSEHNPANWPDSWTGVVRAFDFTHDPEGGLNCDILATDLIALLGKHPALGSGAYIIWEDRIISTDRLAEGWRPYSGANEHRKHLHLSVGKSRTGYNSTAPWGVLKDEDEMTPEQEAKVLGAITASEKRIDARVQRNSLVIASLIKAVLANDNVNAERILKELAEDNPEG